MVIYRAFTLAVAYYCCFCSLLLGTYSFHALRIYTLGLGDNFVNVTYAEELSAGGPDFRVTRNTPHPPPHGSYSVWQRCYCMPLVIRLDLITRDEFIMSRLFYCLLLLQFVLIQIFSAPVVHKHSTLALFCRRPCFLPIEAVLLKLKQDAAR